MYEAHATAVLSAMIPIVLMLFVNALWIFIVPIGLSIGAIRLARWHKKRVELIDTYENRDQPLRTEAAPPWTV